MIPQKIKLRNGTAAQWTTANPILAKGETGYELTVGESARKAKIGDGVTAWNDLEYFAGGADLGNIDAIEVDNLGEGELPRLVLTVGERTLYLNLYED